MNRREAIQTIAMAAAATIFLPACSGKGAVAQIVNGRLGLNEDYMTYLAKISQSILPVHGISDKIPNAVAYLMTMLNDCRSTEEIRVFATGFDQFMELVKKARIKLVHTDSEEIAKRIVELHTKNDPPAELIRFLALLKELSITNLLTSQYYREEYEGYLLVPEPYIACTKREENG